MYGIHDGQSFEVFVRRESVDDHRLVFRFECKDGMGVLGIRKTDRTDPAPSNVYQEGDIDPDSLRAGRFVHILSNGQRQSYALSRVNTDVAKRLPNDSWVELEPLTEYGFRYLIVPDDKLVEPGQQKAAVAVAAAPAAAAVAAPAPTAAVAAPPPTVATAPKAPRPAPVASASNPPKSTPVAPSDVPPQTPMAPSLAKEALARLDRDGAVKHLEQEMAKVSTLQRELTDARTALARSEARERDLLELLAKWREG